MSRKRSTILEELRERDRDLQLIYHSIALLQWDQETGMPKRALHERSEQLSLLEGIAHERLASKEMGELLCEAGSTSENPGGGHDIPHGDYVFLRALRREYDRAVKIPKRLVTELAREISAAQSVWAEARENDDFPSFAPHLEKLITLNREKSRALGLGEHPYDALLDEYEPWMTTAKVDKVFGNLKKELVTLVQELHEFAHVDDSFLHSSYPLPQQEALNRRILSDMGYDFDRGRIDVTAHPFTTAVGSDDVRITTRYKEHTFTSAFFGTVHEAGHALYELGIDDEYKTSVLGEGSSLGIHESRSRTWENMIARSIPFWRRYYSVVKEFFPSQLEDVTLSNFIKAINKVHPSCIRIEADEVTYSLHIILRYQLEQALVKGDLSVKDLPAEWNRGMEELLGIRPKNDGEGVLQDVHWSMGAVGYFPTYALGNLYAAQFYSTMWDDLGDVDTLVLEGKFYRITEWMRTRIHRYGKAKTPAELLKDVTGEALKAEPFIRYLRDKYTQIQEM
ncbi:MAG: carboxypeptidase M32 [Spirochaetaceae bacterium]